MPRLNCFRRDPRLEQSASSTPSDYIEPIFDRGHMSSAENAKDNLIEQLNTYVMSNMSPQHCRFNRGIWLSIEHLVRAWASLGHNYSPLYITTGAIFDRDSNPGRDPDASAARMVSKSGKERVAVPSHYYKSIIRNTFTGWVSISFLLPHTNEDHGATWADVKPAIIESTTTLAEIEEKASIKLYPGLNRGLREFNGGFSEMLWPLEEGGGNLSAGISVEEGGGNFSAGISEDNNCVVNRFDPGATRQ